MTFDVFSVKKSQAGGDCSKLRKRSAESEYHQMSALELSTVVASARFSYSDPSQISRIEKFKKFFYNIICQNL